MCELARFVAVCAKSHLLLLGPYHPCPRKPLACSARVSISMWTSFSHPFLCVPVRLLPCRRKLAGLFRCVLPPHSFAHAVSIMRPPALALAVCGRPLNLSGWGGGQRLNPPFAAPPKLSMNCEALLTPDAQHRLPVS